MHINIKNCNTPYFYDTYHTFYDSLLQCFDNMFLQEAGSRRSKHLFSNVILFDGSFFFLLSELQFFVFP